MDPQVATLEILFLREALIFQIVEEEEQFQLTIIDVAHEGRQYTLPFPASKRVADVKRVAAVVTAIPVFRPVFHSGTQIFQCSGSGSGVGAETNHS